MSELSDSCGQFNCKYCLHLIFMRFNAISCEYVAQVLYFKCAECRFLQHWLLVLHRKVAWVPLLVVLGGLQGSTWWCRGGHQGKLLYTPRLPHHSTIFSYKMSGEPAIPIASCLLEYFPQGNMMVRILDASGSVTQDIHNFQLCIIRVQLSRTQVNFSNL